MSKWIIRENIYRWYFSVLDLNDSNRQNTMLLALLPEKLQTRLEGWLIDINDLEIDTELNKGTNGVE